MQQRSQPATLLDLVSFLSLAAFLGLATGITLGIIALLLAGPAYGAEADTPSEGTLLLRTADGAGAVEAPLVSTDVQFRVGGPIARARVVQTFRNPAADWYEGVYVFPLPQGAAVDRLLLHVGERVIEGEIRERGVAKQVYDQARRSGRRAALLDQERPNVFTASVANIGPQETIVVELEYQETLRYDGNRFSLRFPMVVGPRYVPAAPMRVSDSERITPPVMRPGAEGARTNPVSIRVELEPGFPLASLASPYHRIDVRSPDSTRKVVSLSEGTTPANRDFELDWAPMPGEAPQAAWFVEKKDGKYYGLLMVMPPSAERSARLPREVIFVLDTSGSMAGASIKQAREALVLALSRLQPGDRFNVIEFNSYARSLFGEARDASAANIAKATRWVESLEARGGTEMAAALDLALNGDEASARVRQVIFLTDGAVGNEESLFGLIQARLGNSRLFTVGIGSAPNSHFMAKASQLGRGTFTYIGSVDEVKVKMGELFAKLETPVLKGVEIRWPEGVHAEAWPKRVPDLYAGEPLVVTAALDNLQGDVRVTGQRDGETWSAMIPLFRGESAAGLGSAWARAKVASLMDAIREGAVETEVRAQVVALASAHRLVTKYTSFVAVDRTPVRPAPDEVKTAPVPTLLPEGWEYNKVFGELPRGATDSRFAMLTGLMALLLGAVLLALRRRPA
jgi:Ca-activated chloride channel family protein